MEFTVTQVKKREFEPIKVEFTIDSEEALKQLLSRLNANGSLVKSSYYKASFDVCLYWGLWEELHDIYNDLNK